MHFPGAAQQEAKDDKAIKQEQSIQSYSTPIHLTIQTPQPNTPNWQTTTQQNVGTITDDEEAQPPYPENQFHFISNG